MRKTDTWDFTTLGHHGHPSQTPGRAERGRRPRKQADCGSGNLSTPLFTAVHKFVDNSCGRSPESPPVVRFIHKLFAPLSSGLFIL